MTDPVCPATRLDPTSAGREQPRLRRLGLHLHRQELGLEFLKRMTAGFVEHLPDRARVVEDEVEADGHWVAERIITKMPIVLET